MCFDRITLHAQKREVKNVSEFFYKETIGPVLSPVIKVRHSSISPTVVSAIDNLLSPSGNMFTRAETVKNLMKIEKLSLDETSKVLSIKRTDVANKLRLLEFSKKERSAILEYGFSETEALEFLALDKSARLYAIEYYHKNLSGSVGTREYVDSYLKNESGLLRKQNKPTEGVRKFVIRDAGFVVNSLENIVKNARKAGFQIDDETNESDDCYDIHITLKKNK